MALQWREGVGESPGVRKASSSTDTPEVAGVLVEVLGEVAGVLEGTEGVLGSTTTTELSFSSWTC